MLWFIHHSWLDLILLPQSSCPLYFPQCNLLLIAFLLIHSFNSSNFRPLHTSLIGLTASYDWLTASHPFLEFFLFPSFFLFNDAEHYLYLDSGYNWPKLLFDSNTVDLSKSSSYCVPLLAHYTHSLQTYGLPPTNVWMKPLDVDLQWSSMLLCISRQLLSELLIILFWFFIFNFVFDFWFYLLMLSSFEFSSFLKEEIFDSLFPSISEGGDFDSLFPSISFH